MAMRRLLPIEEDRREQQQLHPPCDPTSLPDMFDDRLLRRRKTMRRGSARTWCLLSLSLLSVLGMGNWDAKQHEHSRESRSTLYRMERRANLRETGRKYLVFGSSWDEDDVSYSYPTLLSSSARMVTLPQSSEPVAASVCTQSIVGEDLYNTILLEFHEWTDTHQVVAERLRTRFPDATMIFLRLWKPSQLVYKYANGSTVDLITWKANLTLHSNELGLRVLESGPEHWSVRLPNDNLKLNVAVQTLKASVHTLAMPTIKDFNFPLNLNAYLTFFDPDTFELTWRGNAVLQTGLQAFLNRAPLPNRPRVGTWGSGDDCHVWYSTGQYPEITTGRRLEIASSPNASNGSHKHALEIHWHDSLQVHNPFDEPRMLSLTYLTSCDEHDNRIYPRLRVSLNDQAMVVLDPYHDDCAHSHHLTRTSPVGMIPPGLTSVGFDPMDRSSSLEFRLVGASLLYEAAATHVDMSLEPDPSLATETWGLW